MSSYYPQKLGVVNRYWKRPKPKVYECNVRDAERFYQQSYKDYLEAKEYAKKKASEDRIRTSEEPSSRWGIRRTNSILDGDSYLNSSSSSASRQYGEDSSYRASSVSSSSRNKSPENDIASIEGRLQRLQKLRSELGLPSSEIASGGGSTKVSFAIPSSATSRSPDPRDRRGNTLDVSVGPSFSASRASNRSRVSDLSSDSYGEKSTSGSERSSRFSSKYNKEESYGKTDSTPKQNGFSSSLARDDSDKYSSFKSSAKNDRRYDSNEDSYSYKPSTESKSSGESRTFKSSRRAVAAEEKDMDDCDADAYLTSIRKKFPTSEEILERIKKMDSDM